MAGVAFVIQRLDNYAEQIDLSVFDITDWSILGALVLVYSAANILLARAWWNLLVFFEVKTEWRWAVKTYGLSQLAKYVPGNIFHLAGRQALGMAAGLPARALAKSAIWELGAISIAGGLFGVLALQLLWPEVAQWISSVLFLLMTALLFAAVRYLLSPSVAAALIWQMTFLFISGAVFIGTLAVVMPAEASMPALAALCGAYVVAWLAGLVTPGAPAGVGVRELVLLFLLGKQIAQADLLLAVVLGRVVTVMGDFLFFMSSSTVLRKSFSIGFLEKMINNKKQPFEYGIVILFPLFFLILSIQYIGPAYLADEIGYLAKAAFFGGYQVDGASSYHGGYSLILSPLFFFLDSPRSVWIGVLAINALLWLGSFLLLNRLITEYWGDISIKDRFLILLFSATYPAWVTMSGYAFTSSEFVFIFLCCLVSLAKWRPADYLSVVPHSLCAGYLYWIHPTALGVIFSSLLTIGTVSFLNRNFRSFIIYVVLIGFSIALYRKGLHPWANTAMTPDGYTVQEHYPGVFSSIIKLTNLNFWIEFLVKYAGQLAYITISSFGVGLLGLTVCIRLARKLFYFRPVLSNWNLPVISLFLTFSLFFVTGIGAAMFSIEDGAQRIDHWIYGRYVEGVLIPFLAIGLATLSKEKIISKVPIFILFTITLGLGYFMEFLKTPGASNNLVNTPAFWPQYVIADSSFLKWLLVGYVGALLAIIIGKYGALVFMLISISISSSAQVKWHNFILSGHSKPSSLIDIVRENYSPGICIGFDPQSTKQTSLMQQERFNLYTFYLYQYNYRRMSQDEWINSCNGPFLTYYPEQFDGFPSTQVIVRENSTGLFLVGKNDIDATAISEEFSNRSDIWVARTKNDPCLFTGCYKTRAEELINFSQVGVIQDGRLATDGRSGYLFYGPYQTLDKGFYFLTLQGNFSLANDAVIDIVSDQGRKTFYAGKLCHDGCVSDNVQIPFELKERATGLEVRLNVSNKDYLAIDGYQIVMADKDSVLQSPSLRVHGKSLALLPKQVGRLENTEIVSDRRAGYLVFGPYRPITNGEYQFVLWGRNGKIKDAWVDVVSNKGSVQHGKFALSQETQQGHILVKGRVKIEKEAQDVEVRVYVGADDEIILNGYELVPINEEN